MKEKIPPIETVKDRLSALDYAELQALSDESTVPFTTLLKIRNGITRNPGIETVRLFWPELVKKSRATA